jgi:hypothetical protein
MAKSIIEIEADEDDGQPIPVKLVGKQYLVNPPKSALAMNLAEGFSAAAGKEPPKGAPAAQVEAFREKQRKQSSKSIKALKVWIRQAFGPEGADEINARLLDPDDKLDYKHLMNLMSALSEATTGDPTT